MTDANASVMTAFGEVDGAQLTELQQTYDTGAMLRAVGAIDELIIAMEGYGGIKESLMRLHSMLNTVLNGAGLTTTAEDETLPELASDLTDNLFQAMLTLRQMHKLVEPITKLAPNCN
jgi:hypothetical protein